jgi:hypothetical protein
MSESEKYNFSKAVKELMQDYIELPEWTRKLMEQKQSGN